MCVLPTVSFTHLAELFMCKLLPVIKNCLFLLCFGEANEMEKWNDARVIEVGEIPAGMKLNTLTMVLESHRHTGLAGVTVEALEFLPDDQSRALITLSTAESMSPSHCVVSLVLLHTCSCQSVYC